MTSVGDVAYGMAELKMMAARIAASVSVRFMRASIARFLNEAATLFRSHRPEIDVRAFQTLLRLRLPVAEREAVRHNPCARLQLFQNSAQPHVDRIREIQRHDGGVGEIRLEQ